MSFHDNGDGIASLSGTPAATSGGAYPFTVTSANSTGSTNQDFILYVDQAPSITSANTTTFTYNEGGSFAVTTLGYPNVSCSETGLLPGGVSFALERGAYRNADAIRDVPDQHRLHQRLRQRRDTVVLARG